MSGYFLGETYKALRTAACPTTIVVEFLSIMIRPTEFGLVFWVALQAAAQQPQPGQLYRIESKLSGKVLDVAGCSLGDGGRFQLWSYNGTSNQQWRVVKHGDSYAIVAAQSGKVIDVEGFSRDKGVTCSSGATTRRTISCGAFGLMATLSPSSRKTAARFLTLLAEIKRPEMEQPFSNGTITGPRISDGGSYRCQL